MLRFFPASYRASLTARDVQRPTGPHLSDCNHSQATSWQVSQKESDHQTGGWNSWILSSAISSGLRSSIKQHEGWEHTSGKPGPCVSSQWSCFSHPPWSRVHITGSTWGYQLHTVSAEGRAKHSTFSGTLLPPSQLTYPLGRSFQTTIQKSKDKASVRTHLFLQQTLKRKRIQSSCKKDKGVIV